MDLGQLPLPAARVIGFTFPNSAESTLNSENLCTAKFQTQRSLLSELLAAQVMSVDEDEGEEEEDDLDDLDEDDLGPAPITRQGTYEHLLPCSSEPITIPCTGSVANQRVKDAYYRRLAYQRQVEQLYQQQQRLIAQQRQQQALLQQQQQQVYHQQQQAMAQQAAREVVQGRPAQAGARCHPNVRVF